MHLAAAKPKFPVKRQVNVRTRNGVFEHRVSKTWQKFFVKGINLGLAVPGYYPGEYPIGKRQYRRWFEQMIAAGFNSLRVYTIQSPSFYEALAAVNDTKGPLYLIQGIWIEPPDNNDFSGEVYLGYVRKQITEAINIIFGNATLPERPGHPHGSYVHDVSHLILGFIFGREWEGCPLRDYNRLKGGGKTSFSGAFLSMSEGTPFERWICRMLDEFLDVRGKYIWHNAPRFYGLLADPRPFGPPIGIAVRG